MESNVKNRKSKNVRENPQREIEKELAKTLN